MNVRSDFALRCPSSTARLAARLTRYRRAATWSAWIAWLPILAGSAAAQEPAPVQPGDRIRVHSEEIVHFRTRGDVVELRPDGLLLRIDEPAQPVFLSSEFITRIERETGRRRATLDGAFLGALTGLITGIAIIAAAEADDRIDPVCGELHCHGAGMYLTSTAVGAAAGALLGSRFTISLWERVRF